jgi:hypothetical protein
MRELLYPLASLGVRELVHHHRIGPDVIVFLNSVKLRRVQLAPA